VTTADPPVTARGHLPDFGLKVINFVATVDLDLLLTTIDSWGAQVVRVDDGHGPGPQALFDAFADQGVVDRRVDTWRGFDEELVSALRRRGPDPVVLVWTGVDRFLDGALSTLVSATSTLTEQAIALSESGPVFFTFLVGDGPNFPRFDVP
jgi:hypothetical protein